VPLLLTDPECEYAEHAKREADQAGDHADEHWIHGSSLCSAKRTKPKSPAIPAPVQLTFTYWGVTVHQTLKELTVGAPAGEPK
jgi:hypothetical protein